MTSYDFLRHITHTICKYINIDNIYTQYIYIYMYIYIYIYVYTICSNIQPIYNNYTTNIFTITTNAKQFCIQIHEYTYMQCAPTIHSLYGHYIHNIQPTYRQYTTNNYLNYIHNVSFAHTQYTFNIHKQYTHYTHNTHNAHRICTT